MSVEFTTTDMQLQQLYNSAEEKALKNILFYGERKVMKEGGQYQSLWLETQPMGGQMYAKRNIEVARNNIEIFMDFQREDGRLPGVIYNRNGRLEPSYTQFQGLYFAMPAFELYFLIGKDVNYLNRVYNCLKRFDAYLWKTRDSDNNGCLETWCLYDNGEDHSERFNGFPNAWFFDYPPTKELAQKLTKEELKIYCKQESYDSSKDLIVPIESMDIMSYSYSCRYVLSLIAKELKNGEEQYWKEKSNTVKKTIKEYLWDGEKKACFDRDRNNQVMPVLLHNNLRCMYFGSFSDQMADDFVQYHLMNPDEFWTKMPLPSVAANDPLFRNITGNNWSGQSQGLTYQRSIQALENYGHFAELTLIGKKLFSAVSDSLKFTQQFDPFTGKPNNSKDGYGPTILATLEFVSRFYGIHITQDRIFWSSLKDNHQYKYSQIWNNHVFRLETAADAVNCYIDGNLIFSFTKGARITTDLTGNILEITGVDTTVTNLTITGDQKYDIILKPNEVYKTEGKKNIVLKTKKPFRAGNKLVH